MAAIPSGAEVAAFAGWPGDSEMESRAASHVPVIAAAAQAYTRGIGFNGDQVDDPVRAVIMLAAARMLENPAGDTMVTTTQGPFSQQRQTAGFTSWSAVELMILNDLRRRTNRPVS